MRHRRVQWAAMEFLLKSYKKHRKWVWLKQLLLLLLRMALSAGDAAFGPRYLELVRNTVALAGATALLAAFVAVLVAYGRRLSSSGAMRIAHRVAGLGYAIPGSIMAVGVLIPLAALDRALATWTGAPQGSGLLLTGGVLGLVYAYLARFLVMPLNAVDAGLTRITPSMDAAARSLGEGANDGQQVGRWMVNFLTSSSEFPGN